MNNYLLKQTNIVSKNHFYFIFIILLFFTPPVASQSYPSEYDIEKDLLITISGAYFYAFGQERSLAEIEARFPILRADVFQVKLEFYNKFSSSIKCLDSLLELFSPKWDSVKQVISKSTIDFCTSQDIILEDAKVFISTVRNRSLLLDPENYLIILQMFRPEYSITPELEMRRKETRRFIGTNHHKAKNIDFQIDLPISWAASEGNRPNIIQKFRSMNNFGKSMAQIMAIDLEPGASYSKKEVKALSKRSAAIELLPNNAKYITSEYVEIDGLPTVMCEYTIQHKSAVNNLYLHVVNYSIYYSNKLILLQFSSASTIDKRKDADFLFKKNNLLYKLIANSLVVTSQWNE